MFWYIYKIFPLWLNGLHNRISNGSEGGKKLSNDDFVKIVMVLCLEQNLCLKCRSNSKMLLLLLPTKFIVDNSVCLISVLRLCQKLFPLNIK